ncbi:caldesmon 1a [Diretmus argenteus]
MDDMDFERRRELRRQKREEMRLEAERLAKNNDDEEEAARERRRRARQDRLKTRDDEETSGPGDSLVTNSHSVTDTVSGSSGGGGGEEEQAQLERMAKREERRQRRMMEALEKQKEDLDAAVTGEGDNSGSAEKNNEEEERPASFRRDRYRDNEEEEEKPTMYGRRREEKEPEEEKDEEAAPEEEEEEEAELGGEEEEEKPRRSYPRQQESTEDDTEEDKEVSEILQSEDYEVNERGGASDKRAGQRKQNGGLHEETPPKQHRKPERTFSARSPEVSAGDQDDAAHLEAERKLEELKRRRDEAENEEFEKMRQKAQEAEVELEELKKKREERRKVLEEEERQKKQEEADRKAKEEEEKRKMKEEIERRRAEAAEKRQKVDDGPDEEGRPFKCVSPRGSSLKIGERAEFLNKSAQKSAVKTSFSPVVSKIDNRLEQYTSAAQRENRECRSPRSGAMDLPLATGSIRDIKSMWQKGKVGAAGGAGGPFKEAAGMKIGVAGRINEWLNRTPEGGKREAGGKPADLKPVDVTNKRSLWETKGASPAKVTGGGETKSVANVWADRGVGLQVTVVHYVP